MNLLMQRGLEGCFCILVCGYWLEIVSWRTDTVSWLRILYPSCLVLKCLPGFGAGEKGWRVLVSREESNLIGWFGPLRSSGVGERRIIRIPGTETSINTRTSVPPSFSPEIISFTNKDNPLPQKAGFKMAEH